MPDQTTQNTGQVDELQQAIDSIAADTQQGSVAGTPMVDMSEMPLPPQQEAPKTAVETTSNNEQVTTGIEIPAAPAPAEVKVETPVVEEPKAGGFDELKKQALGELKTLAEKVDLSAEDKFDIYKEVITETGDKSCLQQAYTAAQGIADETEKVKALLFVVDTIKKSE